MWRQHPERVLIVLVGVLVVLGAALVGGVHPENQVRLSVAALLLFMGAIFLRTMKKGALTLGAPFWVLLAVVAVTVLQVVELPIGWLTFLQPRGTALAAYVTEGLGGPARHCLSLDPPGTALEVANAFGLVGLVGAATLLVRDRARAVLLLWAIDIGALALAVLAVVQMASGAAAVYWVYAPEAGRGFVAPFVNPNHAGAFYGAVTFLNLGLSMQLPVRRARITGMALSALPAALVVASASRGAIVATALGGLFFLLLQWRTGALSSRRFAYSAAVTLIIGTVALPSSAIVRAEFEEKTNWQAIDEETKFEVWRDAIPAVADHSLVGFGRGAFRTAFPAYQDRTAAKLRTVDYAENLLVQWLVDLGPILFGLLFISVGWFAYRYLRRVGLEKTNVIVLSPLAVLVVQNLVDFNLEFPGTSFLAVACLAVFAGTRQGSTRRVRGRWRRRSRAALLAVVALLGLAAVFYWGHWGAKYDLRGESRALTKRLSGPESPRRVLADVKQAIRRHPTDYYLQYLAGAASLRIQGAQPLWYFNRALTLSPRSPLTQYEAGRALQRLGLYDQAFGHYLKALNYQMPIAGTFAEDLLQLLKQIRAVTEPGRRAGLIAGCRAALGSPGGVPTLDCQLLSAFMEWRRAEPLRRVAQIDEAAAFTLAQWLEKVERFEEARVTYEQLLAGDPDRVEYLEALVRVCDRTGSPNRTLYWARRWVARSHSEAAYIRLGELLVAAGHMEEAERVVDTGLLRWRRSPVLAGVKAAVLVSKKQYVDARLLLEQQMQGVALPIPVEIKLTKVRIMLEQKLGNDRRLGRLQTRLYELQNLLEAEKARNGLLHSGGH